MDTETTLEQSGEGKTAPNEAEARAKRLGWVPIDEFKGDPAKHRSAEEFLERGETLLPILKRDNDKLHDGMTRLERRLEDQAKTFTQFMDFSSKAQEAAYKRGLAEREAKLDAAIETADVAGARQARKELAEYEASKPEPVKVETATEQRPVVDPVIQTWLSENDWYDKSPSLRAYATEIFGDLEKQFPGKNKVELLAETKQKTVDRFPDKFGINLKREGANAVNEPGGGVRAPKKGGKTYEDLPPEAKKACDKFVKTIPGYTKEKYVKDYEWD